ncbi:hypothetical protein P8935_23090 [Telmatobacter sp. DSM 110680]|uniref:Uncharacterized protein n=1 Tax=Telmatobacter sp. DSM 110680 TaxID=3036704 RepID=A0AAU7DI63_9BACT
MKQRFPTHFATGAAMLLSALPVCRAQQSLTWEQVKAKFEAANPSLKANALTVQEAHAQEITAYLRPNPQFLFLLMELRLCRTTGYGSLSRALTWSRT